MHQSESLGVTWLSPRRMRTAVATVVVATMAVAGASPASAGKPPKSDGGSNTGALVCDDFTTLDLGEVATGVGADFAWAQGLTGAGVDVAIIDTGVNEVPSLAGRVLDGPDLSFDGQNDNLRHRDLHGHGTNMAAIIAADDSDYGDGIAPGARIVNVKVGAGDGAVDVSQVIAAINWVVEHKNEDGMNIRVLNLAYGTDGEQSYQMDPLSFAVENAWRNGIVVVAAAGNEGRDVDGLSNPATNPFIMAIGGAGKSEGTETGFKAANWTSKGDGIRDPDLVAPGECLISASFDGSFIGYNHPDAVSSVNGNTYLRGTGTSQSAGVVSGAVALLLEQRPELAPDQVKEILNSSTRLLTETNRKNSAPQPKKTAGSGLLDIEGALSMQTPSLLTSSQFYSAATGMGTLEGARGTYHVGEGSDILQGEWTAFGGQWDPASWTVGTWSGDTWSGGTWSAGTWSAGTWSAGTWSAGTWSGGTWSAGTWSGGTWSGGTWSAGTWSGGTWSGGTWSGGTWSGGTWSAGTWSGGTWS